MIINKLGTLQKRCRGLENGRRQPGDVNEEAHIETRGANQKGRAQSFRTSV